MTLAAAEIWQLYAADFKKRWGIDREVAAIIGARSKSLFAAEFKENGESVYRTSVVLPIRNAFYAASQMETRWNMLKIFVLHEPILDYGCGVGVTLLWLKRHGFKRLYGYEVPGVQHSVMQDMFKAHQIDEWTGQPVETVLCINVLEHVADPVALLTKLLSLGSRVIANICMDGHEESHIAPHSELDKCRLMLEERKTLAA